MSGACHAIIQEGPRKGLGCLFPAEDDGYCGRHKRNKQYDEICASGRFPCRFFFRGCDAILSETEKKTCSGCINKKHADNVVCKRDGCKYQAKENGYCGKHHRDIYREQEKSASIKYCDIDRGCFNVCDEGRSSCEACLSDLREKDNSRYAERKAMNTTLSNEDTSVCCHCGNTFRTWISRFRKPVTSCDVCYTSQEKADRKRQSRERNYKEERFNNCESLYKQYVRAASLKQRVFSLTLQEFKELVANACHYCGQFKEGEAIGIDRVNNDEGYILSNVVPACWNCNHIKYIHEKEFFLKHCKAICDGKWDVDILAKWADKYRTRSISYKTYSSTTAIKRGLEWAITEETYYLLKSLPCYICSYVASPVGIDRYDSSKGYIPDNVRPCCFVCNYMKSDMSYVVFREHIKRIVVYSTER